MLIVIDFTKKLTAFNLFENFFYTLNQTGDIKYLNISKKYQTLEEINYDDLREEINYLLYNYHINKWSICLIDDINRRKNTPLEQSITSNIFNIKNQIITPLSNNFQFEKLYYLSLDDINRNEDNLINDDKIKLALDFEVKGYLSFNTQTPYSKILFTNNDFNNLDSIISNMETLFLNQEKSFLDIFNLFKTEVNNIFKEKINTLSNEYKTLDWYKYKLVTINESLLVEYIKIFKNYPNKLKIIPSLSNFLKNALKMEVSTYQHQDTIFLNLSLDKKNNSLNQEKLKYHEHLKIIATIIYLGVGDTTFLTRPNNRLCIENHFEINPILNEEKIAQMLNIYNQKLNLEASKIKQFILDEVEYYEYSKKTFNFSTEMNKVPLEIPFTYKLLPTKKEIIQLNNLSNNLYMQYQKNLFIANRRMQDVTMSLRIQKESVATGKKIKGRLSDITNMMIKCQKEVENLRQQIAFYHPKPPLKEEQNIKLEYDEIIDEVRKIMAMRINKTTLISYLFFINIMIVFITPFLQLISLSKTFSIITSLIVLIIPNLVYIIFLLKYLVDYSNKIEEKVHQLIIKHEQNINYLFNEDNEIVMYVENIYNLIMLKKYINHCKGEITKYNQQFSQLNYHYKFLNKHIEISNKLIEVLNLKKEPSIHNLDKINNLILDKSYKDNLLYSPLNYLSMINNSLNKVIFNEQKEVEINNNLLGFISKLIINYDKEYDYD